MKRPYKLEYRSAGLAYGWSQWKHLSSFAYETKANEALLEAVSSAKLFEAKFPGELVRQYRITERV